MMNGRRVDIRVAKLMDSVKLPRVGATGVPASPWDIVRSLVTFRETAVLLRSMTVQPSVPLMSTVDGIIAIMGHTTMLVEVRGPVLQAWRKEIEADRL